MVSKQCVLPETDLTQSEAMFHLIGASKVGYL